MISQENPGIPVKPIQNDTIVAQKEAEPAVEKMSGHRISLTEDKPFISCELEDKIFDFHSKDEEQILDLNEYVFDEEFKDLNEAIMGLASNVLGMSEPVQISTELDENGRTTLMNSCLYGDFSEFRRLLAQSDPLDLLIQNSQGFHVFSMACALCRIEIIELFCSDVRYKDLINTPNRDETMPLSIACFAANSEKIVPFLIDHGAMIASQNHLNPFLFRVMANYLIDASERGDLSPLKVIDRFAENNVHLFVYNLETVVLEKIWDSCEDIERKRLLFKCPGFQDFFRANPIASVSVSREIPAVKIDPIFEEPVQGKSVELLDPLSFSDIFLPTGIPQRFGIREASLEKGLGKFLGLKEDWWRQFFDADLANYGPNVFDLGLHGIQEQGFLMSFKNGYEWVQRTFGTLPTEDYYREMHSIVCAHFTGKPDQNTFLDVEEVVKYRSMDMKMPYRPPLHPLPLSPIVAQYMKFTSIESPSNYVDNLNAFLVPQKMGKFVFSEEWDTYIQRVENIGRCCSMNKQERVLCSKAEFDRLISDTEKGKRQEDKSREICFAYYPRSPEECREKVTELFNEYNQKMSEYNSQISLLSLDSGENPEFKNLVRKKLAAIANLYQQLEWLHPFPDGQGRTDILLLVKLLTEEGFNPPILFNPYISSVVTLEDWIRDLEIGMALWRFVEERIRMQTQVKDSVDMEFFTPTVNIDHLITSNAYTLMFDQLIRSGCKSILS